MSIEDASVWSILADKGSDVWTIDPSATVFEALALMAIREVGSLVVTEEDRVVGLLSERDYARKVVLRGESSKNTSVGKIMARGVITVTASCSLDDCMEIMTTHRVRHIPVVKDERLVGIVSIGDVVKTIMDRQKSEIEQLQLYIRGG